MDDNITEFIKNMGIDSLDDIVELYQDYINECNQLVLDIEQAFKETSFDYISTEKIVHNLKGVSANLYINAVYEAAAVLDDALKTESNPYTYKEIFNLWKQVYISYNCSKIKIVNYFMEYGFTLTS